MLSSLSIRHRLILIVAMNLVILSLLAVVNFLFQREANSGLRSVRDHTVLPMLSIQRVDDAVREVRFRIAGVLLDQLPTVGSRNHLKEVRVAVPQQWAEFKSGFDATNASAEAKELIVKVDAGIGALPAFFDRLDAAYDRDDKKALAKILEDEWPTIYVKVSKPLGQLLPKLSEAMDQDFAASNARGERALTLAMIAYAVAVGGVLVVVLPLLTSMGRSISDLRGVLAAVAKGDLTTLPDTSKPDEFGDMARSVVATVDGLKSILEGVRKAADNMVNASQRLTRELDTVIERGQIRSQLMDHAAHSIGRMTNSARSIAESAAQVSTASEAAGGIARDGDSRMGSNILATQRVESAVDESAAVIGELSTATRTISQMTGVIREIADQTNLLALNAAIEAARAGEQGRGFAVVADEVRKLAERTSASTGEIAETVGAISARTESAVVAMAKVAQEVADSMRFARETRETLAEIVGAAERVTSLSQEIVGATSEQTTSSQSTARDMEQAAAVSSENSASIRLVGQITGEVDRIAHEMQSLIGRFRLS